VSAQTSTKTDEKDVGFERAALWRISDALTAELDRILLGREDAIQLRLGLVYAEYKTVALAEKGVRALIRKLLKPKK
jgi:hypothetical protein